MTKNIWPTKLTRYSYPTFKLSFVALKIFYFDLINIIIIKKILF